MRLLLTARFVRNARALGAEQRTALFEVMLALPSLLGDPHLHAGAGVRKVHPSGIWEARVGLGLRAVFGLSHGDVVLDRVGTHDDIRRYLKSM